MASLYPWFPRMSSIVTNMGQDYVILNGELVPANEAKVSIFDLGFLRGVGAFETLRTYGGHPHGLDAHLDRLWQCAKELGMNPLFSASEARQSIAQLRTACGYDDLRVNMIVTPGANTDGLFGAEHPTTVIAARELKSPAQAMYDNGVAVVTFRGERHLPHLKTTNYLTAQTGHLVAQKAGAHEALYCSPQGRISEGLTCNVLLIRGDTVIDPEDEHLTGITMGDRAPGCRKPRAEMGGGTSSPRGRVCRRRGHSHLCRTRGHARCAS